MTLSAGIASGGGFECPLYEELDAALEHANSLAHSMRKLKKSMKNCAFCDQFDRCPVIDNFRHAIDIALEEITRGWNLKG